MTTKSYSLPPAPITSPQDSFSWAEWYRILRIVANLGQTAYITVNDTISPALTNKLNKNAADVLNGEVTFGSSGAFKIGSATWNGTTGTGTGVFFSQNGIVGMNGGTTTFVLKIDGTATFGGNLDAATGTFAGSLSAASGTFAGSLLAASGTFVGTLSANSIVGGTMTTGSLNTTGSVTATGTNSSIIGNASIIGAPSSYAIGVVGTAPYVGVWGQTTSGTGVYGNASSGGIGIHGWSSGSGGQAIHATGLSGSIALVVDGPMTMTDTTVVTNLNADMLDGVHVSGLLQTSNSFSSGTALAIFPGNDKPGSTSSVQWLQVSIGGSTYYIPAWT